MTTAFERACADFGQPLCNLVKPGLAQTDCGSNRLWPNQLWPKRTLQSDECDAVVKHTPPSLLLWVGWGHAMQFAQVFPPAGEFVWV